MRDNAVKKEYKEVLLNQTDGKDYLTIIEENIKSSNAEKEGEIAKSIDELFAQYNV